MNIYRCFFCRTLYIKSPRQSIVMQTLHILFSSLSFHTLNHCNAAYNSVKIVSDCHCTGSKCKTKGEQKHNHKHKYSVSGGDFVFNNSYPYQTFTSNNLPIQNAQSSFTATNNSLVENKNTKIILCSPPPSVQRCLGKTVDGWSKSGCMPFLLLRKLTTQSQTSMHVLSGQKAQSLIKINR